METGQSYCAKRDDLMQVNVAEAYNFYGEWVEKIVWLPAVAQLPFASRDVVTSTCQRGVDERSSETRIRKKKPSEPG